MGVAGTRLALWALFSAQLSALVSSACIFNEEVLNLFGPIHCSSELHAAWFVSDESPETRVRASGRHHETKHRVQLDHNNALSLADVECHRYHSEEGGYSFELSNWDPSDLQATGT